MFTTLIFATSAAAWTTCQSHDQNSNAGKCSNGTKCYLDVKGDSDDFQGIYELTTSSTNGHGTLVLGHCLSDANVQMWDGTTGSSGPTNGKCDHAETNQGKYCPAGSKCTMTGGSAGLCVAGKTNVSGAAWFPWDTCTTGFQMGKMVEVDDMTPYFVADADLSGFPAGVDVAGDVAANAGKVHMFFVEPVFNRHDSLAEMTKGQVTCKDMRSGGAVNAACTGGAGIHLCKGDDTFCYFTSETDGSSETVGTCYAFPTKKSTESPDETTVEDGSVIGGDVSGSMMSAFVGAIVGVSLLF